VKENRVWLLFLLVPVIEDGVNLSWWFLCGRMQKALGVFSWNPEDEGAVFVF